MITHYCCGKEMYSEITKENYLVATCKVCGHTVKLKVNFGVNHDTKPSTH